jgi:hypothetical protein
MRIPHTVFKESFMRFKNELDKRGLKKGLNYGILGLCLLPVGLGFFYVYLFGVNVPMWDDWAMVPVFEKYFSGTLTFSELFAQHNEHRIFFPRITMLFLGLLTKFNTLAEMYVIQGCLLASLVIIFLAFRRQFDVKAKAIWFIPIPFMVFSLKQHENMLFGFQIGLLFAYVFALETFYLVTRIPEIKENRKKRLFFILAIICGTVSSFSSLMGLLVWPAGFIQIMLLPMTRAKKVFYAAAWAIWGILVWLVYFYNYTSPPHHTTLLYFWEQPLNFIRFFVTSLGSSLYWSQGTALAAGIVIILLMLVCLFWLGKNKRVKENNFWIATAGYSCFTMFTIAVGRSGMGLERSLNGTYATFSLLTVVALYIMLMNLIASPKPIIPGAALILLLGLITVSIPLSYVKGFEGGRYYRSGREKGAFILTSFESQPDGFLQSLYPRPEEVKKWALILKKLGYNVFAGGPKFVVPVYPSPANLSLMPSPTSFCVDTINDRGIGLSSQKKLVLLDSKARSFVIAGWAVDKQAKKSAGGVYLDIDGKLYPTYIGLYRGDVEKALKVRGYRYCGFEGAVSLSDLGPGRHTLALKILTKDKKAYYSPPETVVLEIK